MSEKKSQFIEVETLTDSQYVPVFGSGVDRKISKPNLFSQIKDESFSPFIYPTIAILQSADLEVDVDNPTYCRCEETEYRLYKITNAAPGVDDITLTNGNTAEYQIEYRDTGFVTSVATAATGALAVFTDSTGQEIDKSVVPTNTGKALVQAADSASIAFPRKNADNTVTMRSASQYFDDIKQSATHGAAGVIKTADGTSTLAQTATDEAITPANLATLKASNAETLTGTDDTKYITSENLQYKLESDGVLIIDNFAALASTPVVAGSVYYLKEYHTGTGYGGGQLLGVAGSTTYDNGITFSGGGGYFRRINYPRLTPYMFGLKKDGVTDGATAMLACYTYAAATGGDLVVWEAGEHIISQPLPGTWGVRSQGASKESTVIFYTGSTYALDLLGTSASVITRDICSFSDMKIDGTYSTGAKGARIGWNMRSTPLLRNVHLYNFDSHGLHFLDQNWNVSFDQVEIDTCGTSGNSSGIFKDAAVDVGTFNAIIFNECIIENCGTSSSTAGGVNMPTTTANRGYYFNNCIIEGNHGTDEIYITNTDDVEFNNLYVERLDVAGYQTAVELSNCTGHIQGGFIGASGSNNLYGIEFKNGSEYNMSGMTMSAIATAGIRNLGSTLYLGINSGAVYAQDSTAKVYGYLGSKFQADKNGTNQTAIASGAFTKVTFTTERYDEVGTYDAANSRWTPQSTGLASINASVTFTAAVDATQIIISIYKNGIASKSKQFQTSGTGTVTVDISAEIPSLSVSDYFEIYVRQSSGSNQDISGATDETFFCGKILR